ncbi:MAG: hypothetical protein ACP5G0_12885 [Desulfomonilia bacterium]
MAGQVAVSDIARDVRALYGADPRAAREAIREYLETRLGDMGGDERIAVLRGVQQQIRVRQAPPDVKPGDEFIGRFLKLLLGERAQHADFSSPQLMENLAESLNTLFDSLNEIIGVMNATLGRAHFGEETIRAVIGGDIETGDSPVTLEEYLGQIKKAFLVAHTSFQQTARTKVKEILAELSPQKIESGVGSGLKFGPLRKAELFDLYEEAHEKIRKWFASPRFTEDLLREFERNCQKSYSKEEVRS